jgi:acyl-CoA synthetase (AMP-forming)/AMP-acid ligase II
MAVNYSATWTYIPSYLSISQLMQSGTSATSPEKIIYEEAITGKTAAFGEFHDQIRRLAYYLRHQLFLQPGDIVSISAASCIDYILVAHSVWWVGGIVSPINNSLHVDEIVHALNLIKPQVLVVDETLFGKLPQFLDTIGEHSLSIYTIGHKLNTKWTPLPVNGSSLDLEREPVLHSPITPRNFNARDTCAAILLSSGTTGAPKAVMLSHLNLVAVCYQLKSDNPDNWRGNQREIFFPPLSHVYGLYVCFTMNLWIGAYVCLLPRFEVGTYCRLLHERSATLARIVPAVARILAENPVVRQYEYPDLEYFSCSAAPLHVT